MATKTFGDDGKKSGRGSTNNAGRLAAFGGVSAKQGNAEWSSADPRWILAVILGVSRLGGAVTFSLSRDAGAYGLRLMLDGDHQQLWFNGDANLDAELEKVCAVLETLGE